MLAPDLIRIWFTVILSRREIESGRTDNAEPPPDIKNNTKSFSWTSNGKTDVGKARKLNEDSMLVRSEAGMWVVADGMGGHEAGDVASQMVVNTLKEVPEGISLEKYIDDIEDTLIGVNKKLIEIANQGEKPTTVGSTVVAMLAYEKFCAFIWAGDSRLYRHRNSKLVQLTIDHSQVQLYVEQGLITKEEAENFLNQPLMKEAIELRKFDDLAKELNKINLPIEYFQHYVEASLRQ